MKRTKHTPGPWNQIYNDELATGYPVVVVEKVGHSIICNVDPFYDENMDSFSITEETWANAHLIAAAPEMLEALKRTSHMLEYLREYASDQKRRILDGEQATHIDTDIMDDFWMQENSNKRLIAKAEGRDD